LILRRLLDPKSPVGFLFGKGDGCHLIDCEPAEASTVYAQDSSEDEDDLEDGPDEAIWAKTSYIGPKMPKKYSLDDKVKLDENGSENPFAI